MTSIGDILCVSRLWSIIFVSIGLIPSVLYGQGADARRQAIGVPESAQNPFVVTHEEGRDAGFTVIPKVSPELRSLATTEGTLPVFIYLRDQPLRAIYNRVAAGFDVRLAAAEDRVLALVRSRNPPTSELRAAQRVVSETIVELRRQVASDVQSRFGPEQDAVGIFLEGLGAQRIRPFQFLNMLRAEIPTAAFPLLEADPRIAEIGLIKEHAAQINISVPALGADFFWDAGFLGQGETVAVLDSGVRASHSAFAGRVDSATFLDSNSSCSSQEIQSPLDFQGHGTHVAGIIASQGTAQFRDLIGVAPGISRLLNLKISCSSGRSFTDDNLRAVVGALYDGINIVNNSNGGPTDEDDDCFARRIDELVDVFNLVWVNSAGNGGPGPRTLTSPGTAFNVISVGSVNTHLTITRADDSVSGFSSRGPTVGGRAKPDLVAPGEAILSTDSASDGFVEKQGTSMAAPHIAGSAALLRQAGVRTRLAIKALLINTTDRPGWEPDSGWGYADLALALSQKGNMIVGQALGPRPSEFQFFKGSLPGHAALSTTLTWNRFVGGQDSFLRDLDLELYDANRLTALSDYRLQNVEQIFFPNDSQQPLPVVLKVKALNSGFGFTEPYALALSHSGFVPATGPQLSVNCVGPASAELAAAFSVDCTVSNRGDLKAFAVSVFTEFSTASAIRDKTVSSAPSPAQVTPDIDRGESFQGRLNLSAPAATGRYFLTVTVNSQSYGETLGAETSLALSVAGPSTNGPAIGSGGIVLATGTPVVSNVSPNSIVTLFGKEFAPAGTLELQPRLDSQGRLSTVLGQTCVEINGHLSPVFAVLPSQINLQASHLVTPGNASVVVIRGCGTSNEQRSAPVNVQIAATSPAFFNFVNNADGKNPIAALHGGGPQLVGPLGLFPGLTTTPAAPGEFISLFATGLGPTNPSFDAGQIPGDIAPINSTTLVSIGGISLASADMFYVGVAPCCAGLYQLVVRIPDNAPDGDLPVTHSCPN